MCSKKSPAGSECTLAEIELLSISAHSSGLLAVLDFGPDPSALLVTFSPAG